MDPLLSKIEEVAMAARRFLEGRFSGNYVGRSRSAGHCHEASIFLKNRLVAAGIDAAVTYCMTHWADQPPKQPCDYYKPHYVTRCPIAKCLIDITGDQFGFPAVDVVREGPDSRRFHSPVAVADDAIGEISLGYVIQWESEWAREHKMPAFQLQ